MTPHVGFDPDRIRALTRRTVEAIEALGGVRSDDPAAAEAVRAARNARRNLEDAWMPLLQQIDSSDVMTRRTQVALGDVRAEWTATARWLAETGFGDSTDDELLVELALRDEQVPYVRDPEDRVAQERWLADQHGLAAEIGRRSRVDASFAARVVDAAYASPLAGLLADAGDYPASLRADLLDTTLAHPWWEGGWEMDKYAAAADTLMSSLLDEPARCLDVLGRAGAADALAGWPPLDQDGVARFVRRGLGDAPQLDASALPAGYDALEAFLVAANGSWLDGRGFGPGAALGIAGSLEVYVPTLAPGLENEHAPVVVKSHGVDGEFDRTLGAREEVIDLLGAVVRTPAAAAELGATIEAAVVHALGDDPDVRIGDVAELAELIDEAAGNEEAEMEIAAATRRTSLVRVGALVGVGIALGAALAGVDSDARSVVDDAADLATDVTAQTVRADTVAGRRVRAVAYQTIQVEACRRFVVDRHARGDIVLADGRRRHLRRRLERVAQVLADPAASTGARQREVLNLVEAVRDAGGGPYLDAILEENSVDDLNELGSATDL